jgi:tetratricopeptide (TPR) repeat protein
VEYLRKAEQLGRRLGNPDQVRFVDAQLIHETWVTGDWDEAFERTDQFIAECEAGSGHIQEAWLRMSRAGGRIARDDESGALDDIDKALVAARRNEAAESLLEALGSAVDHYLTLGRIDQARALADEARLTDPAVAAPHLLWRLAWWKDDLGLTDADLEPYFDHMAPELVETKLCRLMVSGDLTDLADGMAEVGVPQFEAEIRLRAAKALVREGRHADAAAQAEKALAFYRSARATRFIREAEGLLTDIRTTVG